MYGEVMTPCGVRGHTAVVCNNGMHVYGGYQDLKGSTGHLWTFDLGTSPDVINRKQCRDTGCDFTPITWFGEQSLENMTPLWRMEMLTPPPCKPSNIHWPHH